MTALYAVSPLSVDSIPDAALWPKTREIADICDESIYTTRRFLLLLEQEGFVLCSHRSIQNSLRWYPARSRDVCFSSLNKRVRRPLPE